MVGKSVLFALVITVDKPREASVMFLCEAVMKQLYNKTHALKPQQERENEETY